MTNTEARREAVERHDLREENKALKGQVHALRRALRDLRNNVDVSTINTSKRSTARWEMLIQVADETLAACPEPKL